MAIEFLQALEQVQAPGRLGGGSPIGESQKSGAGSFSEAMAKASTEFFDQQEAANSVAEQFVQGTSGNIHEAMVALEKADISLKYMTNVRNKLIDAYREIMQMGA